MRASALAAASEGFTETFEGRVPWPYLDVLGLVTVWLGNLIDPVETALGLDWHRLDGAPVTELHVRSCWHEIKTRKELAAAGARACEHLTDIRLSPDAGAKLVNAKLAANLIAIRAQSDFAAFDDWPADAQLALVSMAWAQGPSFTLWPRFRKACRATNFNTCALECTLDETGNRGLVPRNVANRALFRSAASVIASGGDRDVLHWDGVKADLHARGIL